MPALVCCGPGMNPVQDVLLTLNRGSLGPRLQEVFRLQNSIEIVTEPARLRQVLAELMQAPRVSLDIEADGFYNYRDRVCIVTLSSEELDVIVDTLAVGPAMRELQPLVERTDVPLLMHSGQNDVLALKRDYKLEFGQVQDTAVAATLLGMPHTGLAALVETYLGLTLEKELQRHDWSRRPIEPEHVAYLINDTRHLFRVHDMILEEVRKFELIDEYEIECRMVAECEPREREFDPERFRRIKGHGELTEQQRGTLKALYAWRDELACSLDRAAFRVMPDHALLEMARQLPTEIDALRRTRGVGEWIVAEHAESLLAAIRGAEPSAFRPPRREEAEPGKRLDPRQRDRLGKLKRWRETEAARRQIGLQAVLPTSVMMDLILQPPQDAAELALVPRVGNSRAERYGDQILRILHGRKTGRLTGRVAKPANPNPPVETNGSAAV